MPTITEIAQALSPKELKTLFQEVATKYDTGFTILSVQRIAQGSVNVDIQLDNNGGRKSISL